MRAEAPVWLLQEVNDIVGDWGPFLCWTWGFTDVSSRPQVPCILPFGKLSPFSSVNGRHSGEACLQIARDRGTGLDGFCCHYLVGRTFCSFCSGIHGTRHQSEVFMTEKVFWDMLSLLFLWHWRWQTTHLLAFYRICHFLPWLKGCSDPPGLPETVCSLSEIRFWHTNVCHLQKQTSASVWLSSLFNTM